VKVAVTGASGFVGRHLVRQLLVDGHEVTALYHSVPLDLPKVESRQGSVEDTHSLAIAFEGQQAVFHLVGLIAETRTQTFESTVAQGTRNVVEACRRVGVKKLLYLSALGTSPYARTKYHRTKHRAEQAIIASGIDYVIFRASVIYGPGDGFVSLLTGLIKKLPFTPVIGSGRYRLQPIFIDDLTRAMSTALEAGQVSRKIIDLAGPEILEYLQILDIIKVTLRRKRMNFFIPLALMRPMAFVLEKLMKPAPLTRDQLTMMEMGNTGDITRMREMFGVNPISFEDGLKTYMR